MLINIGRAAITAPAQDDHVSLYPLIAIRSTSIGLTSREAIPNHDIGGDSATRMSVIRIDEHLVGRDEDN
jgi:hypothetical protein